MAQTVFQQSQSVVVTQDPVTTVEVTVPAGSTNTVIALNNIAFAVVTAQGTVRKVLLDGVAMLPINPTHPTYSSFVCLNGGDTIFFVDTDFALRSVDTTTGTPEGVNGVIAFHGVVFANGKTGDEIESIGLNPNTGHIYVSCKHTDITWNVVQWSSNGQQFEDTSAYATDTPHYFSRSSVTLVVVSSSQIWLDGFKQNAVNHGFDGDANAQLGVFTSYQSGPGIATFYGLIHSNSALDGASSSQLFSYGVDTVSLAATHAFANTVFVSGFSEATLTVINGNGFAYEMYDVSNNLDFLTETTEDYDVTAVETSAYAHIALDQVPAFLAVFSDTERTVYLYTAAGAASADNGLGRVRTMNKGGSLITRIQGASSKIALLR